MKTLPTYTVRIYLSGPIEVAKQILREYVLANPLCVTVEPTTFIYTGGEEAGYVVGLVNYPRFPKHESEITEKAIHIAKMLRDRTFQRRALVVGKDFTHWISDDDEKI